MASRAAGVSRDRVARGLMQAAMHGSWSVVAAGRIPFAWRVAALPARAG